MRRWTVEEKEYLVQNFTLLTAREISSFLGRSIPAIYKISRRLSLILPSDIAVKRFKAKKVNNDQFGVNNPNWKGGVSKNNYRYKKIQKERFPEKIKAREIVCKAIKSGKLIKKPCEVCGDHNSHAHHEDYLKPLDVIWLCRKHHRARHC